MHSVMIPNEGIDFNIKEEEIAEVLDDDEAPTSSRTLKQIKEESYDLQDVKREEFIEETYEELQEKYKKLKEESNGKINDQLAKTKLEHLKKMREKKIQERWIRALMHFGVDPKLYIEDKAKVMRIYPFNDFNFIKAKKGEYTKQKMAQVVLELCKFEVINDTYNVECKDITGEAMQGTFHLNCKDKIKKKLKKGSVIVLKNVSINKDMTWFWAISIIMAHIISIILKIKIERKSN